MKRQPDEYSNDFSHWKMQEIIRLAEIQLDSQHQEWISSQNRACSIIGWIIPIMATSVAVAHYTGYETAGWVLVTAEMLSVLCALYSISPRKWMREDKESLDLEKLKELPKENFLANVIETYKNQIFINKNTLNQIDSWITASLLFLVFAPFFAAAFHLALHSFPTAHSSLEGKIKNHSSEVHYYINVHL